MHPTALILAATVALGAASAVAPAARSSGKVAILNGLNTERAANGIPSHVRENRAWSAGCADHVEYMAAARRLTHIERPGSPRYTASGSWAAERSVLAFGSSWQRGNPFESAPLHLIQLMSPELQQIGFAEGSGYVCVTTWPGYSTAGLDEPAVYTYPGNGTTDVPYSETAAELPFVPGDFVGLPRGTATGFNIMVYAEGVADPWRAHIVSATLVGPGGDVPVRIVDRRTPQVGTYLPPGGGFVIPVAPLQPGTTYHATVRFAGGVNYAWSFTTAEA
jgi:hypothetical protein